MHIMWLCDIQISVWLCICICVMQKMILSLPPLLSFPHARTFLPCSLHPLCAYLLTGSWGWVCTHPVYVFHQLIYFFIYTHVFFVIWSCHGAILHFIVVHTWGWSREKGQSRMMTSPVDLPVPCNFLHLTILHLNCCDLYNDNVLSYFMS